jgi:hypothetical protein
MSKKYGLCEAAKKVSKIVRPACRHFERTQLVKRKEGNCRYLRDRRMGKIGWVNE